jgi:uncharacterized protein
MTKPRLTRILCAAEPAGSIDGLQALLDTWDDHDVQALALVGDLGDGSGDSLRNVFKALARSNRRTYWVPGPNDAPIASYLREAANIEVVAQFLRGVHGEVAFAQDGHVIIAGMGGHVSDDPDAAREETERLAYPRWEPEYHLKVVQELDEHQLVLLFHTPPAHKGLGIEGAEVLTELIGTYRPRVVVCAGERRSEMIGRSLVVAPGSLKDGQFAVADLYNHKAQLEEITAGAPS